MNNRAQTTPFRLARIDNIVLKRTYLLPFFLFLLVGIFAVGLSGCAAISQEESSSGITSTAEAEPSVEAGQQRIIDESLSLVNLGTMSFHVPNQIQLDEPIKEGDAISVYGQVNNMMITFSSDPADLPLSDDTHEYSFQNLNDEYLNDYLEALAEGMGGQVLDKRVADIGEWTYLVVATYDAETDWIDYLYYTVVNDCGYAITATRPGQELTTIELDAINLIAASLHATKGNGEQPSDQSAENTNEGSAK